MLMSQYLLLYYVPLAVRLDPQYSLYLMWWPCSCLVGNVLPVCPVLIPAAFDYGPLLQINEEHALAVALNDYLASCSYLAGFSPSQIDHRVFKLLARKPPDARHVHALRWYRHIAALQQDLNTDSSE